MTNVIRIARWAGMPGILSVLWASLALGQDGGQTAPVYHESIGRSFISCGCGVDE